MTVPGRPTPADHQPPAPAPALLGATGERMSPQDEIGLLDPAPTQAPRAPEAPAPAPAPVPDPAPTPPSSGLHVLVIVENVALCVDQRVRKQVPSLLAAGHHVTVITRGHPGNAAWRARPGVTVLEHPVPPESGGLLGYVREYGQAFVFAAALAVVAHRRRPVDVVQICQPPDIYFPIAWWLRRVGAAVVVDQRDLMPELFAARYGERGRMRRVLHVLERRTQRAADLAIGVNQHLARRLADAGAREVAVVRNGPVRERVAAARPEPALRGDAEHLCVWAGKMGRQDRVDLLLEAIRVFVHVLGRRDTRFVLLGDGECLADLRARATALDLDDHVEFPGWLSEEGLFAHLATADVGLDASLQVEVSPVKAMEYMAFGMPVVAFDLPETAVLLEGSGVTVPPGDVAGLAEALSALLDDPDRAAALGRAGAARIAEELGWDHQAEVYLAAIDRVAPAARVRSPQIPSSGTE
jgi:glycosyltransferase involved in cell wall biosynthesis